MVCSEDDVVVWKDFPKGLRVLLLDEDVSSAAETRMKLEAMDYIVFWYQNEKDALEVISKKAESFHVAIVEMTTLNCHESCRFLEMAKDLPTVVVSNVRCLSTMMKCIALGATEFLEKPLSEDKLKNIWQHVVHKAFNAGDSVLSKSLKPVKETVSSMIQLQSETTGLRIEVPFEAKNEEKYEYKDNENSVSSERFSAPSTPQLKQGGRSLDENMKDSFEQRKDNSSESKSVENTCNNTTNASNNREVSPSRVKEPACEEVNSAETDECSIATEGSRPSKHKGDHVESLTKDSKKRNPLPSINSRSHGNRGNRKRMKVDWTPELHRRFVQAVEQLGIDQAIPSKILELMNVEALTRHNVASHLQKFRMHRRHILPKDEDRRWQPHRDPLQRNYMQKPLLMFPPFHSTYGLPPQHVYPVWGHPSYHPSGYQMWGHAGFLPGQPPPESWPWKTYSGMNADAWGCPIGPPYSQYTFSSQMPPVTNGLDVRERSKVLKDPCDPHLAEEMIDQALVEAMNKPWLPLPLGLKPPSIDGVLAELHRQGISTIPPSTQR